MRTLVPSDRPEIEEFLARRRALGQDSRDEMWEGTYHMAPEASAAHAFVQWEMAAVLRPLALAAGLWATGPFNLGIGRESFRVPDFGLHAQEPAGILVPTAVCVGEVLSPDDESWEKFPYYAARGVEEVFVVDPAARTVRVFLRRDSTPSERHGSSDKRASYDESGSSPRLGATVAQLAAIRWPSQT